VTRRSGVLLLATALAALALPTTANAIPPGFPFRLPVAIPRQLRDKVSPRIALGSFHSAVRPRLILKPQNGYEIAVGGSGSVVVVGVLRRHPLALSEYLVRGTVSANRLQGSLGQYGRVSVRFHPSRSRMPATSHRRCRGRDRFVVRHGVFVGDIDFTGEDGYVSVHAHRAKGSVRSLALRCERRGRSPRQVGSATRSSSEIPFDRRLRFLVASWRHAVDSAAFLAIGGRRNLFLAVAEQSEGRLAKLRLALSVASTGFSIDDALTRGRVAPPSPFHGAGTYAAAPDGTKSWTGTLTANFPGAPRYPFTGPPFEAEVGLSF
jgi:hypothetical protein